MPGSPASQQQYRPAAPLESAAEILPSMAAFSRAVTENDSLGIEERCTEMMAETAGLY